MKKTSTEYRKLPVKKRKFIGTDSLWAGNDHLLVIKNNLITESYKRFYYNDIKAIQITQTSSASVINTLSAIAAALLAVCALIAYRSNMEGFSIFLGIIVGVLAVYLAVSLIRGPSCDCRIVTAVQQEKLTPVVVLRHAEKMMSILGPLIEEKQGRLAPDTIHDVFDTTGEERRTVLKESMPEPVILKEVTGNWHRSLYLFLIASAGLHSVTVFVRHPSLILIASLLFIGMGISAIVSVVRQAGSTLSDTVKSLSWVSVGFLIVGFIEGYIEYFFLVIKNAENPMVTSNPWKMLEAMCAVNPFDYPLMVGFDGVMIVLFLFVGITGLVMIRK